MDKRWFRNLFTRRIFVVILLLIQAALFVFIINSSSRVSGIVGAALSIISILVALYIIGQPDKMPYKLTWIFVILALPVFGGLLYLMCQFQGNTRLTRRRLARVGLDTKKLLAIGGNATDALVQQHPDCIPLVGYLSKYAGFPAFDRTQIQYLSPGERFYERVMEELQKAERYIFIESFIIQQGVMWDSVLTVLEEKARAGLDVRVMYDDMGCLLKLPSDYKRTLERKGIKCIVFNPFRPFLSAIQNNRDHRKIVSIDGKVAFTGGNNFADEYINVEERFGHWKDASIQVTGRAAWALTVIFLELWSAAAARLEDFSLLYPWHDTPCPTESQGFSLPYADSPLDKEHVGANVFLQMINSAREYVYINTPYLIIDDTLLSALMLCAKSGVDVRIVTPGIADKPLVHATTRCYYGQLIQSGVKIYEYTPGFIHSKTVVVDGKTAVIGSTNFDYRSLYLHFECGVWMVDCSAILDLKTDFLETLALCRRITPADCKHNIFVELFHEVLRLFAPLM